PRNKKFSGFLQSRQPNRFRQFGFCFAARQPDVLQNSVAEVHQLAARTLVPTPGAEAMSQTVPKTASHSAGLRPVLESGANGQRGQSKNSDVVGPGHGVSPDIGLIVAICLPDGSAAGRAAKSTKKYFCADPPD